MKFTVFGNREVEIDDSYNQNYMDVYGDPLTDSIIRYFAYSSECTEDMDDAELTKNIEEGISRELSIMKDMPRLIAKAKADGMMHLSPQAVTRSTKIDYYVG
jgi:hypothetical protein